MSRIRLDRNLDIGGIGVRIHQIRHVGQAVAVTAADVEVGFRQHVLDGRVEGQPLVPQQPEGGRELADRHGLLDLIAVREQRGRVCGLGVAREENVLDAAGLAHHVAAGTIEGRVARRGVFRAEGCRARVAEDLGQQIACDERAVAQLAVVGNEGGREEGAEAVAQVHYLSGLF